MNEPNPETWKQSHMLFIALSRWDNEGGARRYLPSASLGEPRLQHAIKPSVNFAAKKLAMPVNPEFEAAVSAARSNKS